MGGVFGGDSSVFWKVDANQVKETKTSSVGTVHHQEGIDDIKGGSFKVTIKRPINSDRQAELNAALRKFLESSEGPLVMSLPIEDSAYLREQKRDTNSKGEKGRGNEEQIIVDWP